MLRDHREAVKPGSQGVPAPVQRWEILSGADLKPTGRVCCSRKCPGSRPPWLGGPEPILGSGQGSRQTREPGVPGAGQPELPEDTWGRWPAGLARGRWLGRVGSAGEGGWASRSQR